MKKGPNHQPKKQQEYKLVLKIPFITDEFNRKVRGILTKNNTPVRLVNYKGKTLRQMTRPKATTKKICKSKACPAPGICQQSSVVYSAMCDLCGHSYVGMTTRRLHNRAQEHVRSAKNHTTTSAFGEHYLSKHPNQRPQISFKILRHEGNELRLRIEEALAIKDETPELNRRQEDMGIGFLP